MIDPSMNDLAKNHPITSHYGVYVKTMYDRIGFRAGFSKINLKTSTRLDKDKLIQNYNNIELKSEINIKQTFTGSNEVDLLQKLSYYELPMEFVYALKKDESKIGMEAFTGFSFLILDKNQLSLKSEKVAMQNIGEAKNISGINFSYNLGIGISYKLNDKFNLDINPLFKYYLNTFKESGDAKPYSLSLQSGVTYKF
jgi:opacity protein-like surface antigen